MSIETLKAIRVLCENAPDPDEKFYVGDFERMVAHYDKLVERIYRLCLDALEEK